MSHHKANGICSRYHGPKSSYTLGSRHILAYRAAPGTMSLDANLNKLPLCSAGSFNIQASTALKAVSYAVTWLHML